MSGAPPLSDEQRSRLEQALTLHQAGRLAEAAALYERVLAEAPGQFDALHLSGVLALQRGDLQSALRRLEDATRAQPSVADAWCNLGLARLSAEQPAEAAQALERALALAPDLPQAVNGLARALADSGRPGDALARAEHATRVAPDHPGAWRNRGDIETALERFAAAEQSYRRALELAPGEAELHYSLGLALDHQSLWTEALACYRRALELDPSLGPALGETVYLMRSLCDWPELETMQRRFIAGVREGMDGLTPFVALAVTDERALLRRCAETWSARFPAAQEAPARPRGHRRITVGYLSSGFYRYPTAQLIAGVLERHDRDRFRVVGLDASPDDGSAVRARLLAAFDEHLALRHLPPVEAARRIRAAGVDLLVDLKGYSADAPTAVTALRPAPVQASWLGYPGSVGARHVDYLVADRVVIPDHHRADYPEAVVRLPHSYQANDDRRGVPDATLTRADCGLPEDAAVLCSFNQPYKIGPDTFARWMAILREAPGAVLWLLEPRPGQGVAERLREAAERQGVAPGRLVFAPRRPQPEYLAQLRLADLFLDSHPYNAHTTASDALWMGCPVLTCPGESFAGRVGASLLSACGLDELIAEDFDAFHRLALALSGDRARLQALRRHLESERLSLALFDSARFTRHLEAAFAGMIERFDKGEPSAGFDVEP